MGLSVRAMELEVSPINEAIGLEPTEVRIESLAINRLDG